VDRGKIAVGMEADLTVLDLDREFTIDSAEFESKSENSPFLDWKLQGGPVMTVVNGNVIYNRHEGNKGKEA
jgi:dihydroorotase